MIGPDDFAARVDERSPAVPEVDRGVCLDIAIERTVEQLPPDEAHDAGRDRVLVGQRIADGDDPLADTERIGIAQGRIRQRAQRRDLDERDVGVGIGAELLRLEGLAIGESHGDAVRAVDHMVVEKCLQALNLVDWRDRRLGSLSGGERQRVLLARALAVQAAVLLMDEPIANVDAPNVVQWLALVQGMTAQGQTVVSVLHDLNLALRADRVVVMHEGQVLIQAPAHDPALHTCLQQVFEHALTFHFWQDRWIALPR